MFLELQQRQETTSKRLLAIAEKHLHDPANRERSRLAVKLLTERNYNEVAEFVAKNVPAPLPERVVMSLPALSEFACARAAVTLGSSVVPQIVLHLRRTPVSQLSSEDIDLYALVLELTCDRNNDGLIPIPYSGDTLPVVEVRVVCAFDSS